MRVCVHVTNQDYSIQYYLFRHWLDPHARCLSTLMTQKLSILLALTLKTKGRPVHTRDCTSWLMFSSPDPAHLFTIHLVLDIGRALEGTLPWLAVRSNGWLANLIFSPLSRWRQRWFCADFCEPFALHSHLNTSCV